MLELALAFARCSYDGFWLTGDHYSSNASATLHDVQTDSIARFAHHTKKGKGANREGTSSGAGGDIYGSFHTKSTKKNQTPFNFHEIWHRHGSYQETYSHPNLANFIGLPLSNDHSKFQLKISFCLHIFNKMTITLHVIAVDTFGLEFFEILVKFSFR